MPLKYKQKDLGYKRTPTNAKLQVEMPDGSLWRVPVQIIADSRDYNYRSEEEDTVQYIRDNSIEDYEIEDWANNNMNWGDVFQYAEKTARKIAAPDYQEGWVNGAKEIIGKI